MDDSGIPGGSDEAVSLILFFRRRGKEKLYLQHQKNLGVNLGFVEQFQIQSVA